MLAGSSESRCSPFGWPVAPRCDAVSHPPGDVRHVGFKEGSHLVDSRSCAHSGWKADSAGSAFSFAIALSSMLVASCGSNSIADPALNGTHSYMLEGPSAVLWLSLDLGQRASGTSQTVLGPGLTNDRKIHHYTDRIVGNLSGDTLTFRLVTNTPGDPWGGATAEATISNRRIVIRGAVGDVFTAASTQQFQAAVAARMPRWKQQQVQIAQQCQKHPAVCGSS